MRIQTDLRIRPVAAAADVSYAPTAPLTSIDVQSAIEELQAEIAAAGSLPPAIVPTPVTFAMSPYTVQTDDFLLEVDTSAGAVVLQTQASSTRGNRGFDVKDVTGNASTNNISVLRTGAETLDGLTTYLIASDFGANHFQPKTGGGYEVI